MKGGTDTTKVSQNKQILDALLKGDKLTPIDALNRFGTFRLGARIKDLRDAGFPILTEMVEVKKNTRVARYYLSK